MLLLVLFFAPKKRTDWGLGVSPRYCKRLIKIQNFIFMKIFKNIPADKIGNFILTVITAFVSTFLMQSCGLPNVL